MVRRIVWSKRAEYIFNEILKFYAQRNQSKKYSQKLNTEIKSLITALARLPYLGKPTKLKATRVLIKNHYKIFYKVTEQEIRILLVWDSRQNPKNLNL